MQQYENKRRAAAIANPTQTTSTSLSKVTDIFKILLWVSIIFITWYFMHGADHYLELSPQALGKYFSVKWFLIAHITAGGGALILGPPQFSDRLRSKYKILHRMIGLLYLLAIVVSGTCAVVLAFTSARQVSWTYAFSLQVWVSVWISASFIAYRTALQKKFKLHKEWMTRSYIVTLAFVISGLALKLPFIQAMGSFADISPSMFWLGWSVPLYIYQVVLSLKK